MSSAPKIYALAGSLRAQSFNRKIASVILRGAGDAGADVEMLDLRDFPMPIYNADLQESDGFDANALALQRILADARGLIVVSPEYNGSLPAALKNALDWVSRPSDEYKMGQVFAGKYAAIATASPGGFGGIRCLGHLRSILSVLGMHVLPTEVAVGKVHEMFSGDQLTDERMKSVLEGLGAKLAAAVS